ncbi:sugar phosphate nucleotidyltransferase [Sphingomonas sp. ASV193]|uniref:mannose-1-phosphate guanylyltransferase n=1 Tax=Sphingomonas sp. ASV193 TaxID=3144405 RepID=UPI0032E92E75
MDDIDSARTVRPVILAGGAGTRLWPLSTPAAPKHLIPLLGEQSLFEEVIERLDGAPFLPPIVVANIRQREALERLAPAATLLLEPIKRDSGPAIALAAAEAGEDELLLVCPSDQHIADVDAFRDAVARAVPAAREGAIVTFGIEPDHPATGFGYIAASGEGTGEAARTVDRFVEKPAKDKAEAMLAAGGHYWNAGIFLASAATWRQAFRDHAPAMLDAAEAALGAARREGQSVLVDAAAFARSPAQSVDYAIMEKAADVRVVPVSMGWSDVGSWQSVHDAADKDEAGNSAHGGTAIDSRGLLIRSSGPAVAAIDVDDLVIIATPEAVLVTHRGAAQRVREAAAWFEARRENGE